MSNNEEENPFDLDPEAVKPSDDADSPSGAKDPLPGEPVESGADPEDAIELPGEDEELDLSFLDDEKDEEPAPEEPATGPKKTAADVPVGIPLEKKKASESKVKALDVCPNCGEPMRGSSTLVCMHCGFDLKTMTVVKTELGEVEEDEEEKEAAPLCAPGRGDLWMPGAIAVFATLVLLIGFLVGYDGLFGPETSTAVSGESAAETVEQAAPTEGAVTSAEPGVSFGTRMLAIVHFLAITIFWIGCGLGALLTLARLNRRPFGDVRLALVRTTAIMTAMALAAFVNFQSFYAEQVLEIFLRAILALGLAILLFRLSPRDVATAGGVTLVLAIVLYWGAELITL